MKFNTKLIKNISLSLVGIILITSIFNTSNAMTLDNYNNIENIYNDSNDEELFSKEKVNLLKIEFQKKYGTEDKFIFIEKYENIKSEVNGARGIIKITDINTGDTNTINYFDTLNMLNKEYDNNQDDYSPISLSARAIPSRPTSWKTQGPDKANLSVTKGKSRDTIKAYNPITGSVKTYTKDTNNWYSGYTKGYYNNVHEARKCIGTAKSKAGSAGEAALIAVASDYVKSKKWYPTQKEFLVAFRAIAAGSAIFDAVNAAKYGVLYLGHMAIVYNNYLQL